MSSFFVPLSVLQRKLTGKNVSNESGFTSLYSSHGLPVRPGSAGRPHVHWNSVGVLFSGHLRPHPQVGAFSSLWVSWSCLEVSRKTVSKQTIYLQVPARQPEFIQPDGEAGGAGGRGEGGRKWRGQRRRVRHGVGWEAAPRDVYRQAALLPEWKEPDTHLWDHRLRHHCYYL